MTSQNSPRNGPNEGDWSVPSACGLAFSCQTALQCPLTVRHVREPPQQGPRAWDAGDTQAPIAGGRGGVQTGPHKAESVRRWGRPGVRMGVGCRASTVCIACPKPLGTRVAGRRERDVGAHKMLLLRAQQRDQIRMKKQPHFRFRLQHLGIGHPGGMAPVAVGAIPCATLHRHPIVTDEVEVLCVRQSNRQFIYKWIGCTRLATSVCRLRHDRMGQGPAQPHTGCSTFLLSSGGAGGGHYRVAIGTGLIATEHRFPCQTLVACLGCTCHGCQAGMRMGTIFVRSTIRRESRIAEGLPTMPAMLRTESSP